MAIRRMQKVTAITYGNAGSSLALEAQHPPEKPFDNRNLAYTLKTRAESPDGSTHYTPTAFAGVSHERLKPMLDVWNDLPKTMPFRTQRSVQALNRAHGKSNLEIRSINPKRAAGKEDGISIWFLYAHGSPNNRLVYKALYKKDPKTRRAVYRLDELTPGGGEGRGEIYLQKEIVALISHAQKNFRKHVGK
ncbi:TPA: hypothetical protein HA244_07060 [Candidatus Micrarchaeota archaeon]|nr:hypothetical protein [Candidatus Micrarchaeota archaeon]